MAETRALLESQGIQLWNIGILDLHCDPTMVLGLPGWERKTERYKAYLRDLGRAGIGYTTYAHMANIKMLPYYQTAVGATRGGTPTREFDMEIAKDLPLSHDRIYTEDEIWETFTRFIREVMPVAEEAGVRIGLHPDDPPVPSLGGVARIFRNFEGYRRAVEIADSPNFGLCFCVGSWAEGGNALGKDVFEMIEHFGAQGKLFKIHFRNVDAPLPKFRETLADDGSIDMYAVMRALREVAFDGVLIPDHVPGDGAEKTHSAYTLGYMRAMRNRAYA
jgi:mannonate dehydratase